MTTRKKLDKPYQRKTINLYDEQIQRMQAIFGAGVHISEVTRFLAEKMLRIIEEGRNRSTVIVDGDKVKADIQKDLA